MLRRRNHFGLGANGTTLCDSAILYGCFAAALTLVFGHELFHSHIIARLQPLRAFLMIYAVMFLLLAASMQQFFERDSSPSSMRHYTCYAMIPILLATAFGMFLTQRIEFPESAHIDLPWLMQQSRNPWVRAFFWCRDNTPAERTLRARSTLHHHPRRRCPDLPRHRRAQRVPDFSKDGGEAAISPRLADEWVSGFTAQLNLDQQTASQLREHLEPFGVDWVILRADSPAELNCPYDNNLLKVCKLRP